MEEPLQTQDNNSTEQDQTDAPKIEATEQSLKDRTQQQFEKLTHSNSALNQENKRLRRELDKAKMAIEPTSKKIDSTNIQTANQVIPSNIDLNSFVEVDQKTGEKYVNETKLTQAISNLQSKAENAEKKIDNYINLSNKQKAEQQREEAFRAYPELNPNDDKTFDKGFFRTVRAIVYDSMKNTDEYGRTLSIKEAADYVKKRIIPTPQKSEKDIETEKKEAKANDAKAQAGTMVPSQPQNMSTPTVSDDLKRLRLLTRKGDVNALAQRILATDHVKKKS